MVRNAMGAVLFLVSASALGLSGCGDDEAEDDDGASATAAGAGGCGDGVTAATSGSTADVGTGGGPSGAGGSSTGGGGASVPLKEAKLIIEHNATDLDTGFQGSIDGEGWQRLDVTGPGGVVLTFEGKGSLRTLGLTELFFESVEPENADVPIEDVLAALPAGDYTIEGPTVDGGRTFGVAALTHAIPAGPVLVEPEEGATVPTNDLVISWEPVTETIDGQDITIISYQLIVEKDEEPHPNMIGKRGLSMYLPASVSSMTVPAEFLEPATPYLWEVLAIAESGNQTLSSSAFSTE